MHTPHSILAEASLPVLLLLFIVPFVISSVYFMCTIIIHLLVQFLFLFLFFFLFGFMPFICSSFYFPFVEAKCSIYNFFLYMLFISSTRFLVSFFFSFFVFVIAQFWDCISFYFEIRSFKFFHSIWMSYSIKNTNRKLSKVKAVIIHFHLWSWSIRDCSESDILLNCSNSFWESFAAGPLPCALGLPCESLSVKKK